MTIKLPIVATRDGTTSGSGNGNLRGGPSLGSIALRGGLLTMSGQAGRLLIQLAGIVVLARILSPRDYGLVAMVTTIVGAGELLRDLGLATAAIQASVLTREQRDNLFWINTCVGAALAVLVYLGAGGLAALYREPQLAAVAQALSVTFLLNGLAAQYRAHLTRELQLGSLALITVLAQAAGLATAILLALDGAGYWALVGQQVAIATATLMLLVGVAGWLPGVYQRAARTRMLLRFGWNLLGINLITYAGRNAAPILLGARFGADLLGLYDRALQLVMVPLNQINAPSTTVALPVLSRLKHDREKFAAFLLQGQTMLVHAIVALFAFACAQAQPLVGLVLGEQWRDVVPAFQILAVAGTFQAASYATNWAFLALGLTGSYLRYTLVSRSLLLAVILLGLPWGLLGVATAYSAGLAALWPFGLWWIGRESNAPVRAMFGNGLRALLGYAACGAVSYATSNAMPEASPLASVATGAGAMLAAFIIVCVSWPGFRRDIASIARTKTLLRPARVKPRTAGAGNPLMRIARRICAALLTTPAHPGFLAFVDRLIFLLPPRARSNAPLLHVLLGPPGGGNIGDQAMVDAFLENVSGPVAVIVRSTEDISLPISASPRTRRIVMASLIYAGGIAHFKDVFRLKRLLSEARSFSVVGADVMDGAYNCHASVNRSCIARLARRAGIDTRVLGFSWNASPHPRARVALRQAAAAGVCLVARDPVSAQRARADAIDGVIEGADLVFSARARAVTPPPALLVPLNSGRDFAVVNASELVGRSVDQVTEYREIVRYLQEAGLAVILLPHVARANGGDVRVCRQIYDALGGNRLHLVDRLLAPAQVRAICDRATLVISGRMHLAIIALAAGIPAITLATQGKVEGLMSMFDMPHLCIEPRHGFSGDVTSTAGKILSDPAFWRHRVVEHLEAVRARSRRNFAGLRAAGWPQCTPRWASA